MINLETFLNLQMCEEVILSNTSTVLNMAINTMQMSNFLWHKDFHSMISFRDFVPLGLHKELYSVLSPDEFSNSMAKNYKKEFPWIYFYKILWLQFSQNDPQFLIILGRERK